MGNAKEFVLLFFFPWGIQHSYRKYILTQMFSDFTQKIQGCFSYTRFLKYSNTPHIFLLGNDLENIFSANLMKLF